jgi:hypothetical protein
VTCDDLRDPTCDKPQSEEEDAHNHEERTVLEPRVIECEVEQDEHEGGDEQDPERAALGLPPAETAPTTIGTPEERRVVGGSAVKTEAAIGALKHEGSE